MKRLIIYLLRKKLGVKLFEKFQFVGQKSDDCYWFTKDDIYKYVANTGVVRPSSVSLHWLLDDNCEVTHCDLLTKEMMVND